MTTCGRRLVNPLSLLLCGQKVCSDARTEKKYSEYNAAPAHHDGAKVFSRLAQCHRGCGSQAHIERYTYISKSQTEILHSGGLPDYVSGKPHPFTRAPP